jgi:hypothetical protein
MILHNYHNPGHYPSSCLYLKHKVSETEFCLRLQVEHNQLGSMDRSSLCFRLPATTARFIKPTQHKSTARVNTSQEPNVYVYAQIIYTLHVSATL